MENCVYKYDAFISYRHKDIKVAKKLQKMLEGDIIPAKSGIQKKRLCICRDESEFSAGSSLYDEIYAKLRQSNFLIVICEEKLKESQFCMEEIRYFKEIHNGRLDKVLVVLLEGESAKVLPEELKYEIREVSKPDGSISFEKYEVKPLYCNIRAKSERESMRLLKNEFLKLAAPLLGCGYDDLVQRYLKRRMQRKVTGMAVCMTIISIISVLSYVAWISRRSQAIVYEYTAKDYVEDGKWAEALLYYGKALELEPKRMSSRVGALLLLQQHLWPYQEVKEEYMQICGKHICPYFYPGEELDTSDHSLVSISPSGEYMLWGDLSEDYSVTNDEGEILYALEGKGEALSGEEASAWIFYHRDKKKFTFCRPENRREYELYWSREYNGPLLHPSACMLPENRAVINDNENLRLYDLDARGNQETMSISLDNIFGKRPIVVGTEWEDVDRQQMWSTSDGRILAVSEVVLHEMNQNVTVSSKTALFDTKEMRLLTVFSNNRYVLEKVVFSEHGEYVALLYNNSYHFLQQGGMVSVYSKEGEEVIRMEDSYSFIPRDAVFYDKSFLVWDYNNVHLWDVVSAEEYAVPITAPETIDGVVKLNDGRYAVAYFMDVHYYRLLNFREEVTAAPPYDERKALINIALDEPCQIMDGLFVALRDGSMIILSDEKGNSYDEFTFPDTNMQEIVSAFYFPNLETLFFMDAMDSLYVVPVIIDKRQFKDVAKTNIAAFAGNVCVAEDGILTWDYVSNTVEYYGKDSFDHIPRYRDWSARQKNAGIFMGMCDDDKYAVFVLKDEKNERYIAEIRDMKNGEYINEFILDNEMALNSMYFDENEKLSYLHGEEWSSLKIDAPSPDRMAVRQIISLSGYLLDENQVVVPEGAVVNPDRFGNWAGIFR